ncbi:MAG: tRNA (adenosine(37)-N6)-threonylcarbamoyltransferase complex ATPase subunit type 1 TsaE [Candidatus Yanofskybacteria bacterium]|nr:tRNA (adenosine(37)-N6)-threonylcarbamoyltransferase complex ATPase subunit type 1 TsaE [Candidatus Yanofskybacteria bacterium]
MKFQSKGVRQTKNIASNLAKKVIKNSLQQHAQAFALEGELGAGKTTFVKGFAGAFGIKSRITSPTFVLLKGYRLPRVASQRGKQVTGYRFLYHIDAYRLKNYHDLIPLGIKEIMADPRNIVLIEWSDRVKKILPSKYIKVHIDHIGIKTRKITINNIYGPPSLKLRKGTSSPKEEMLALRSSGGAKK